MEIICFPAKITDYKSTEEFTILFNYYIVCKRDDARCKGRSVYQVYVHSV